MHPQSPVPGRAAWGAAVPGWRLREAGAHGAG